MILVTGATGNIGRTVVKALINQGQPVRAAVISAEDASEVPPGVGRVLFDFYDPQYYPRALAGVKRIFLLRPPQITDMDRTLKPFVDYAKKVGVERVIFVSLQGVEENPRVPHYAVEQHIKSTGLAYTFLRPSFFMQNLNTTHRAEIRDKDELYLPVGRARTSFIDTRDIGAVAARVLTDSGHNSQAYTLTGGAALDYYQVADIFSQALGRKITYRDPSLPAFVWYSWRRGVPLQFVLVMAFLYRATRNGSAEVTTTTVAELLGRPPIPLRQYVEDYAAAWQK